MPTLSEQQTRANFLRAEIERHDRLYYVDVRWDYMIEPKCDGVAFSVTYRRGTLERAATRGNGEIGDDITQNIRTLRSIPLRIPCDAPLLELRGEVFMPRSRILG